MQKTVKQLIANKGSEVYSVPSDHLVIDALAMLADHNIGAVLVIDDGELVGIVSERDYARKVILKGRRRRSATAWP